MGGWRAAVALALAVALARPSTATNVTRYLAAAETTARVSTCGLWKCSFPEGEEPSFEQHCISVQYRVAKKDLLPAGEPRDQGSNVPVSVQRRCNAGFKVELKKTGTLPEKAEDQSVWMANNIEYISKFLDPNADPVHFLSVCREADEMMKQELGKELVALEQLDVSTDPSNSSSPTDAPPFTSSSMPLAGEDAGGGGSAQNVEPPPEQANAHHNLTGSETQPEAPKEDSTPSPPESRGATVENPDGRSQGVDLAPDVSDEESTQGAKELDVLKQLRLLTQSIELLGPSVDPGDQDTTSLKPPVGRATGLGGMYRILNRTLRIISLLQKRDRPRTVRASTGLRYGADPDRVDSVEEILSTNKTKIASPLEKWVSRLVEWWTDPQQNLTSVGNGSKIAPYETPEFQAYLESGGERLSSSQVWHLSMLVGMKEAILRISMIGGRQEVFGLIFLVATLITLLSSFLLLAHYSKSFCSSLSIYHRRWRQRKADEVEKQLDLKATETVRLLVRGGQLLEDDEVGQIERGGMPPEQGRYHLPGTHPGGKQCPQCASIYCECRPARSKTPSGEDRVEARLTSIFKEPASITSGKRREGAGASMVGRTDLGLREEASAPLVYPKVPRDESGETLVEVPPPSYSDRVGSSRSGKDPPRYRDEVAVGDLVVEKPLKALQMLSRLEAERATGKETQ